MLGLMIRDTVSAAVAMTMALVPWGGAFPDDVVHPEVAQV
jgi:hypothetical protein